MSKSKSDENFASVPDSFIVRLREAGLDEKTQDTADLYAAWIKLRHHMQRIHATQRPEGSQTLNVFDARLFKHHDTP